MHPQSPTSSPDHLGTMIQSFSQMDFTHIQAGYREFFRRNRFHSGAFRGRRNRFHSGRFRGRTLPMSLASTRLFDLLIEK
jgi:hypothetical protein